MRDDLDAWNKQIDAARAAKLGAMNDAIASRGVKRAVALAFVRFWGWVEALGVRWRRQWVEDDDA